MKNPRNSALFDSDLNRAMEQWGLAIFIGGFVLAALAMLYPIQYDLRYDISFAERIVGRFDTRLVKFDSIVDIPRNVILFLPLGFGASSLLHRRKLGGKATLAAVLGIGIGVSLAGEAVQLWYPWRSSSLSDILANGLGALFGYACFRQWGTRVLRHIATSAPRVKARLTFGVLLTGFSAYVILILLISICLQRGAVLYNWNPSFPLILGNELTGDRPWRGRVSEVHFADSAITEVQVASIYSAKDPSVVVGDALIASYQLTDRGSYQDRTGHLSGLVSRGTALSIQEERGITLAPDHWLVSEEPAAFLTSRLLETSQFSLITTVATADLGQGGPARIVSISQDPIYRNFTLGQGGTDLVLRLRTRMGQNASRPAVVVPDVFADTDYHRLIISYDSGAIQIYIDGLERLYSVALTPELTFFHSLLGTPWWDLRLNTVSTAIYTLLYYGLIFVPAGLLLALIIVRDPRRGGLSRLWIWAAILLPCTTLEAILATMRGIKPQNLLLGVVITTGAILLFRVPAARFFQSDFGCHSDHKPA